MYTEIHHCLALDFPEEFGPEVVTEAVKSREEMNSDEYQNFKKQHDEEQAHQKRLRPSKRENMKC